MKGTSTRRELGGAHPRRRSARPETSGEVSHVAERCEGPGRGEGPRGWTDRQTAPASLRERGEGESRPGPEPAGERGVGTTRARRRDGRKLGRTHETLVEADQPRLPVVVEHQNRLNHLCGPRFFKRRRLPQSISFRHNTATSAWCAAARGPRKRAPAPKGPASLRPEEEAPGGAARSAARGSARAGPARTAGLGRVVPSASSGSPVKVWPGRAPGWAAGRRAPGGARQKSGCRSRGSENGRAPGPRENLRCCLHRDPRGAARCATARRGDVCFFAALPCCTQGCGASDRCLLVQRGRFSEVGSEWANSGIFSKSVRRPQIGRFCFSFE